MPDSSITPGQSRNPLSPHYGDLELRWRELPLAHFVPTSPLVVTRLSPAAGPNRGN